MAWQMVLQPGYEPSRFVENSFEISMVVGFSTFNLVFFGEKNLENLIKSNKEIHVQLVNDILGGL